MSVKKLHQRLHENGSNSSRVSDSIADAVVAIVAIVSN